MLEFGGFIVYDDRACIVRNTWNFSRFYHEVAVCVRHAVKEQVGWKNVMENRKWPEGHLRKTSGIMEHSVQIEGNTICPLGDAAGQSPPAIRHLKTV
jgi:NADH-quinone oxidoreductase subunit F